MTVKAVRMFVQKKVDATSRHFGFFSVIILMKIKKKLLNQKEETRSKRHSDTVTSNNDGRV